jgi:catechol 2,3-dioxygenase-like lactoylglutathione lyase family enzyme
VPLRSPVHDAHDGRRTVRLLGIVWTGVQTSEFDAMSRFMERLIGAPAPRESPGFRLWSFPDGDILELYAGGTKPGFEDAPVVGFRVDDLTGARERLVELGAEIIGGYGPNEDGYASIHFRAPDGNVYELTYDPDHERRSTG